ncbi:MAG: hypothetical protein A2Z88_10520 [Omnitrophica WOR_2 bacterium GWA2_47_8]|nr:MAG: hypothetical protein A2Z88_10520 [Omnitrophica WOR_2 bacterium GWA2_47_8]
MKKHKKIALTTFFALLLGIIPYSKAHKYAYATRPAPREAKMGVASWYSKESPGIKRTTANNEIFDDTSLTCAMWGVPFHQKLRITNLQNGRSIVVRVNDRGPHKRLVRKGRVVDLTKRAFASLGATKKGLIPVKVEFL